jgi:Fungal N-terminal domain of STAND proteins
MPVPYGFSVGDFIAALELVSTVIDALRSSNQVRDEYSELMRQLYGLETALLHLNRLSIDDAPVSEVLALRQMATQCQGTIDKFRKKVQKYDPALRLEGADSLKAKWKRVKWSLCRNDDIRKFQADLLGHTEAISLLIETIQLSHQARLQKRQSTLAGRIQDGYQQCMAKLGAIYSTVTVGVQQGKHLFTLTATVLRTNIRIFQAVMRVHDIVTQIPFQIERQQPVFLVDAIGRVCPFHLEFIRSFDAFKAVMMVNLAGIEGAANRIEREEFALEDAATQRDIDLSKDWDTRFYPGQRVEMSIIVVNSESSLHCPSCGYPTMSLSIYIEW